jgi:hypothetical protein
VDRLDLRVDRAIVEQHLEQELRAVRGLSHAERESLFQDGMRENTRYRLRALMRLTPEAQFRMILLFAALDDANSKFTQRLRWLGSDSDRGSHAEFFARAAGYIPASGRSTSLSLLPDDPNVLAYDLTILMERTSKGSGLAWKRANQIARDLLRWRKRRGITPAQEYQRPLSLERTMFNTRLAQELRFAGQTHRSLQILLTATGSGLDVHKIIDEVFSLYQSRPVLRDIDTANVCLSLLPTEIGECLALEYWRNLRPSSRRRMVHRLTRPRRVATEARRQGTYKSLRATVEMFLRSIGLRDYESPVRQHEESFEDLVQSLGAKPTSRLWDGLLGCRDTFHGCLSIVELQKRKGCD